MEYFRANNQIQADFAYRVGKIATVYAESTRSYPSDEVYEATLYVCLLQNLLTSCSELIKSMSRRERANSFFTATFTDIPSLWGLRSSMVVTNTFYSDKTTYEDVISHLRNALSHPTDLDLNCPFPSTGFDSIKPTNGQISTISFVDSPDVKSNRPKYFEQKAQAERVKEQRGFPPNVRIEEVTDGRRIKYQLCQEDKEFARIFRIDVPVNNLKQCVIGMSDHLSIAIQPEWEKYLAAKEGEQTEAATG